MSKDFNRIIELKRMKMRLLSGKKKYIRNILNKNEFTRGMDRNTNFAY